MRYIYGLITFIFSSLTSFAQITNTFPPDDNVGIGTVSPVEKLHVIGNVAVDRIRTGGAIFLGNSRSSFNSFNPGTFGSLATGWIAADFGGNDNASDRLVVGTGFGGKVIIGSHNYNLTAWGGAILIAPQGGNVGIGSMDPGYKLDVNGTGNFTGKSWFSYGNNIMSGYSWTDAALTTNSIEIVNSNNFAANLAPTLAFHNHGTGGPQFRLATDGSNVFYLESAGANSARNPTPYGGGPNLYLSRFHIDAGLTTTGNVGIGTADPKGYKLAVAGNMIAESVKVKLQGTWPDFVFTNSYKLPTLLETEEYIKEKGHLAGIPSAAEAKANGIDLGEMNAKLLQKIEEMTLYLIEMKKEIDNQKKVNQSQQQEMKDLKKQLNR